MNNNKRFRPSERRRCIPAFLTSNHRGFEAPGQAHENTRPSWRLEDHDRTMAKALTVLPKLASQIGFAMAAQPKAAIDVLPGTPTTVTFTVAGKLKGLMVLPIGENDARKQLGLPPAIASDLDADALFEEQRQDEMSMPDEQLAAIRDKLQ